MATLNRHDKTCPYGECQLTHNEHQIVDVQFIKNKTWMIFKCRNCDKLFKSKPDSTESEPFQ